jgi:hypothetical protein
MSNIITITWQLYNYYNDDKKNKIKSIIIKKDTQLYDDEIKNQDIKIETSRHWDIENQDIENLDIENRESRIEYKVKQDQKIKKKRREKKRKEKKKREKKGKRGVTNILACLIPWIEKKSQKTTHMRWGLRVDDLINNLF